jgi:hypothetical protein
VVQDSDAPADPGADWVALPWPRSPRWFLPRAPAANAKAGLSVYHPVTWRSRAGWETARVVTGLGALRLRHGSSLLPREVWEAVRDLIPSGGGLSVARANHPGRFLALVFDGGGRPVVFAKVARDTIGARALHSEREALRRFGPMLPNPLFAPAVIRESEGVLVLGPIDWRPRSRAWRLPEEVGYALGAFFASTSADGGRTGVAHGDFAPWNLLETSSGWAVIDWENCRECADPYYDLFHYLVQSNSELRRPRKRAIIDGLMPRGWVGATVEAYSTGSGIDIFEARHLLARYLAVSGAMLDPDAPGRGTRVRDKLTMLLEASGE